MVSGTVSIGLVFAVLVNGLRYESAAKSTIFLPMAISFVGAGVIWSLMYAYRPAGHTQIGLLNAIISDLGGQPVAFLVTQWLNTFMLIIVGIWIWTGFCMTMLSSAIKGVSPEILEAARIDGANEAQIFFQMIVPIIMPTITVVVTTMVINVLKLFDIVYVMTGGNYKTDVLAVRMYTEMYINYHPGRGTAIAVVLILLIIPFMYMNIQRFLEEEASR
jgi:alpha-glucoside transport system permease protein